MRETYAKLFTADGLPVVLSYKFEYNGQAVNNSVPMEAEIASALQQMQNGKAPGLTCIQVDQMKVWYLKARPEEGEGDPTSICIWEKLVAIVQRCIHNGDIPDAFMYGILVLIPKDNVGGVQGIGLLETVHKLASQIINLRMAEAINFHEDVHGFCRKRGTHTAIGETKIRMQMATSQSSTLFQVYLNLRKAYDSINQGRILLLLAKYGVGPCLCRYIAKVWDGQHYVLRQASFFSDLVEAKRGCTQGGINSQIIFNVIVDAVTRTWRQDNWFWNSISCFYADDRLLESTDPVALQQDLDQIIELFGLVGLQANEGNTKYMII